MTTNDRAQRALDLTSRLVEQFGPRLAGRESTLAAADALKDEFATVADDVRSEDFAVHPGRTKFH